MPFEYGQIVLVPVDDGHGNTKPHPAVILSPTDQIVPGERLRVVCISTQVESPCPSFHVPLPWQRPRHSRTGLNKPNVAKCNWLTTVDQDSVLKVLGIAPASHLARIQDELARLSEGV